MRNSRIHRLFLFSFLLLTVLCCREEDPHQGRVPLASVGDMYLYKDEVNRFYATHSHGADSATYVKEYVDRWVNEMLFYNKAKQNVPTTGEIDIMVENYRKNLILNLYQDALIDQQLVPNITQEELQRFYDENSVLFEAEKSLFKGLFVKLPERTKGVNDVRRWCMGESSDDFNALENYCMENASEYGFFMEEWYALGYLAQQLPLTEQDLQHRLESKDVIEFKDNGFIYFVSLDTLIAKGGTKPLELVTDEVREFLVNSKKAQFIKNVKASIYNEALESGQFVIYD